MGNVSFDKIPGLEGRLEPNNIELTLRGSCLEKVKKILTIKDKGIEWQISHLKKALETHQMRVHDAQTGEKQITAKQLKNSLEKIPLFTKQISELEPQLIKRYYGENEDGTLNVPSGFYYMCERVVGDYHLNTEIAPFYVDGLRPYQVEAVTELLRFKRGTLSLATGLGKTRVIASLALSAVKSGRKIMIIVPTVYLVGQMFFYLKTLHKKVHAIGGDFGQNHPGNADILVITADSAEKYIDSYQVVALDETHHSPSNTWFAMMCCASAATHVYACTATPFRQDGKDLGIFAFAGPVVYERDCRWGIENKWLTRPVIAQVKIKIYKKSFDPSSGLVNLPSFIATTRAYADLSVRPEVLAFLRDKVKLALDRGRKAMVIFKTIEAGEAFREACKGLIDFRVAHGLNKKTRSPLVAFNLGKTNILVSNVKLVSEGIDIPNASALFNVVQNSGEASTLQMLGRVLRLAEGKKDAFVMDVVLSGFKQFETAGYSRNRTHQKVVDSVSFFER